jgi:ATP-dependent RNA helicase DDX31/DBP7
MPSWNLLSGHAVHAFIGGLASFRIYCETRDPLWAERAEHFRQRIKTWKDQGCLWNFENKNFLLDAENYYSNGNMELAQVSYDNAISSARQHKFLHEEALAYELAAIFYLNTGSKLVAFKYFTSAHGKYIEWGAFAKVRTLYAYVQETFKCDSLRETTKGT